MPLFQILQQSSLDESIHNNRRLLLTAQEAQKSKMKDAVDSVPGGGCCVLKEDTLHMCGRRDTSLFMCLCKSTNLILKGISVRT